MAAAIALPRGGSDGVCVGNLLPELLKFIIVLAFAPALVAVAISLLCHLLVALLPVATLAALIVGAAAGLGAGFTLCRRLGRSRPPADTPPPPEPIRRPRGPG